MAKYYVITAGEYSDYHIEQVTTDKKLAEAYVKLHGKKDYDSEYMRIEEFDDLIDQCDIQNMFDNASVLHPYLCICVRRSGEIYNDYFIKECLRTKDTDKFHWEDTAPKAPVFNEQSICYNFFEMWVQADKYGYDYDKIIKVVMDTRAKMLAEREGL